MEREKPAFSLITTCPTFVFGPLVQPLSNLDNANTSSQRIYDFIAGRCKDKIPDTGISFFLWIDVRDLALAHVKAIESKHTANKRYLLTAGYFCNREICDIIRNNFPEYEKLLPPSGDDRSGGYPTEGIYKFDNRQANRDLEMTYRTLEESLVDAVKSMQDVQHNVEERSR